MKAILKNAICWILSEDSQWRVWGFIDKETATEIAAKLIDMNQAGIPEKLCVVDSGIGDGLFDLTDLDIEEIENVVLEEEQWFELYGKLL